jgi:hypothetical protein
MDNEINRCIEEMKNEVNKFTVEYIGKYYGNELIVKKTVIR